MIAQFYPELAPRLADHSYFNPLAWQFLFSIGMFVAQSALLHFLSVALLLATSLKSSNPFQMVRCGFHAIHLQTLFIVRASGEYQTTIQANSRSVLPREAELGCQRGALDAVRR